ncbi:MAG TPA: cytochrome c [Candidatus Binataceae bacterium]|nr:cytochrome c [Candidatus Binataceae bacterium]
MKRRKDRWSILIAAMLILALGGTAHSSGARVFAANCAVCHQNHGQGVPGTYPSLAGTVGSYVRSKSGRAYLVQVVSFGMNGAIVSRGAEYNGFMQPWTQLSDADISAVLNYILDRFNAKILPADFKPYTAAEVKYLRATHLSFDQVRAERDAIMKPAGAVASAPSAMKAH